MSEENRIERWTQKLLDFSARNRLLNIPAKSKSVLRLKVEDIAKVEDRLSAHERIAVPPLADFNEEKDVRRRLSDLMREARRDLEETGSNTLFLTLGGLEWTEDGAARPRIAPILLVPVRLERASMSEVVKLSRLDEETTVNTTLVEFLRSQHGIAVAGIDPPPADDSGVDVKAVLAAFADAVKAKAGWSVREDCTIGTYSFGKFVMWKDMTDRAEELKGSPLVAHLLAGGGRFDDGIAVFPPEEVAQHVTPGELFCPVSYDSSQLTAVLYSELGKSFVLHGPPGTGKSQTITNIIAHNLARGRRVLFVSEKKAALDVVKNRLDKVGLTPFCLELHSNKSEKAHVYGQIREALEVAEAGTPRSWRTVVSEFDSLRFGLEAYVRELHRVYPNGLTPYSCFARAIQYGRSDDAGLIEADTLKQSQSDYQSLSEAVRDFASDRREVGTAALSAIPELSDGDWSPALERELKASAEALADEIHIYLASGGDKSFLRSLAALRARIEADRNAFFLIRFFRNRATAREMAAIDAGPGAKVKAAADALADHTGAGYVTAYLDEVERRCRAFAGEMGELRPVMRLRKSAGRVRALGAGGFVKRMCEVEEPPSDMSLAFENAYAARMLEQVLSRTSALADFAGLAHEERIARFRELDERQTELARKVVFSKLAKRAATLRDAPTTAKGKGSELGTLRRECEKKRRQKPVRQLLAECRELLPTLKPCFLMSPLSVAQYLGTDAPKFDMVVFDEASQIPVWDAIGVIARANQLVVVGDPKQMPPTSFFQKGEAELDEFDEGTYELEDQESILDECLVAGVPSTYLSWHYRSRHESLIAFSNEHYYDGRLFTFPAATNESGFGVKFKFVEGGRFVKQGKGPRVNPVEAKALVDYVCEEVKRPGRRARSVGIVTFSLPQQKLISDLIEERRSEDPELERLLPEEGEGSYFVKNLENVQGDESDVILFSVGYAPDENGRLTMNFGPLNLSGGERRLNVAVTRAKEQVVVFSSIHGAQIDAGEGGRTKAVGAADLKAFLEYAERGPKTAPVAGGGAREGGFGDVVAEFLRSRGWGVDRDVGCSNYRIDVAVKDPSAPDRYIMGIECDGPSYAHQRTEQDRDVNRAGVLGRLGWRMCRVWSVDWALDRARAQARLLEMLK